MEYSYLFLEMFPFYLVAVAFLCLFYTQVAICLFPVLEFFLEPGFYLVVFTCDSRFRTLVVILLFPPLVSGFEPCFLSLYSRCWENPPEPGIYSFVSAFVSRFDSQVGNFMFLTLKRLLDSGFYPAISAFGSQFWTWLAMCGVGMLPRAGRSAGTWLGLGGVGV